MSERRSRTEEKEKGGPAFFRPTLAPGTNTSCLKRILAVRAKPTNLPPALLESTLFRYSTRYLRPIPDVARQRTKTWKIFTQANGILGEKSRMVHIHAQLQGRAMI